MMVRSLLGATMFLAACVVNAGCNSSVPPPSAIAAPGASDAVSVLCAGVPETERERPNFLRRGGIDEIREFDGALRDAKFGQSEVRGAEIAIRAAPELTRQRVARVLRCHAAWRDTVGFAVQARFDDPLAVGRPEVSFDETERGVVLRIAGRDREQGEEILRRAEALLKPAATARN